MASRDREEQWVPLTAEVNEEAATGEQVLDAALVLRPRSAPQLLDLGIEVLVVRLLGCIGICTLIWFPLRALMPWVTEILSEDPGLVEMEDFVALAVWILLLSGGQTLASLISTTSVTLIVHAELIGQPISAIEAFKHTLRRLLALIAIFVITLTIFMVGGGLLGILAIFCPPFFLGLFAFFVAVTWKFSVAPSALVLEDLGVFEAISRSFELTKGSFLRWAGLIILVQVLASGLSAGIQLGDTIEIRDLFLESVGLTAIVFHVAFVAISSVFSGVATAIAATGMTAFYLDTRIRREGFDLTMRLERLQALRVAAVESTT